MLNYKPETSPTKVPQLVLLYGHDTVVTPFEASRSDFQAYAIFFFKPSLCP